MLKKLLLLAIAFIGISNMQAANFLIVDEEGCHYANPAYVDKELREIPQEKVAEILPYYALYPVKMDNGEYALHGHVRGPGGGAVGAGVGVAIGAGATWAVFNTAYWGVGAAAGAVTSMVAGPVAGSYVAVMTRTAAATLCKPVQVATTKTVALGCGIALGAATGPV